MPDTPRRRAASGPGRQHGTAEDRHEGDGHGQCQALTEDQPTPRATATAGLTYVMTEARAGPTSAISAKKTEERYRRADHGQPAERRE